MKLLNYLGEFFQHDRKLQYQLYLNVVFLVMAFVYVCSVCVCCVHVCVCVCVCACVRACVCARAKINHALYLVNEARVHLAVRVSSNSFLSFIP